MSKRETTIGIFCFLIAATVFYLTKDFPGFKARGVSLPGPSFFPNFIASILLICGVIQIIQGWRQKTEATEVKKLNLAGATIIILACLAVVAYVLLLNKIGFQLLTFAFLLLTMVSLQVRPLKALSYSLLVVAVMVLVFDRIFHIPLPYGLFHL